jgi:hypothetical protein
LADDSESVGSIGILSVARPASRQFCGWEDGAEIAGQLGNVNQGGSEVDLVVDYAARSFLNFQSGYSHFFVGDYVRQSMHSAPVNGGTVDANYFYLMMKFRF